jgi:hypothetical protein
LVGSTGRVRDGERPGPQTGTGPLGRYCYVT